MKKRLIIINRMYAGKYLTEGENIGHEIINLIRSDNGNNYVWLNADGNCDISKFVDKQGNNIYDEIIMLMVRMYGHRQWKVLAKAEINMDSISDYMVPRFSEKYHRVQVEKIKEENICYGGQPLDQVFNKNYFNGHLQSGIDIYFTFKADNVYFPVMSAENIEKTVLDITNISGLANQSLRMYFTEDKNADTYGIFNDIIDGKTFDWEKENTAEKVSDAFSDNDEDKDYFLKIINEEYRELTFSNLLAYFLKNKKVMSMFAKEVLKLNDFNEESYSIAREEKNIDLFISSPNHYIIIENKIRSGLIRETKNMEKRIREYFGVEGSKSLPKKADELLKVFDLADYHYQTDRYYAYACGTIAIQNRKSQINGYVLFPNYMLHNISKEIADTLFKENYALITYRELYEFFCSKRKISDLWNERERKYLDEYLSAIKKHTKDVDNSFEEEMKTRFYKQIQKN